MANKKIKELELATAANDADDLILEDTTKTKRISFLSLAKAVLSRLKVEEGANKYAHPSTHPATMITEDVSHRFVTDTDKSVWNNKLAETKLNVPLNGALDANDYLNTGCYLGTFKVIDDFGSSIKPNGNLVTIQSSAGSVQTIYSESGTYYRFVTNWDTPDSKFKLLSIYTHKLNTKLNGIADKANNYVHPANHPAVIITEDENHRFATDGEKDVWNAKASTTPAAVLNFADSTAVSTNLSTQQVIGDRVFVEISFKTGRILTANQRVIFKNYWTPVTDYDLRFLTYDTGIQFMASVSTYTNSFYLMPTTNVAANMWIRGQLTYRTTGVLHA